MPIDHSHIVPVMYLRPWTDEDGRIQMVLAGQRDGKLIGVRDAGVRSGGFYKRERPDGERSDDVETVSIQGIESEAAPILRNLDTCWPLTGDDKVRIGMLAALQLVRGPRFFEWHDTFAEENLARYRAQGRFEPKPGVDATEDAIHRATLERVTGSTDRLIAMLRLTTKVASALGSMNWNLIAFRSPVLATSDHPIVAWPPSAAGRSAQVAQVQQIGIGNVLEFRYPVSPTAAMLMTWRDRADGDEMLVGKTRHAENINAFTIIQAEMQWFYKSGARRPRQRSSDWLPLAPELLPGYSIHEAAHCQRRQRILSDLNGRVGERIEESLEARIHHIPHGGESDPGRSQRDQLPPGEATLGG